MIWQPPPPEEIKEWEKIVYPPDPIIKPGPGPAPPPPTGVGPIFVAYSLRLSKTQANVGDILVAFSDLRNEGSAGSKTIEWRVDSRISATRSFTLLGGEKKAISHIIKTSKLTPGEHVVSLLSEKVYFSLTGTGDPVEPPPPDPEPPPWPVPIPTPTPTPDPTPLPSPELKDVKIIEWTPKRELVHGDTLSVTVELRYKGKLNQGTIRASIGNWGWAGFDEILRATRDVTIPASSSFVTYRWPVDILITKAISDGIYSLQAKITGPVPDKVGPVHKNVISVNQPEPPAPTPDPVPTPVPTLEPLFSNLELTGWTEILRVGETCKIRYRFQYSGPAYVATLHAAIGNHGLFGFNEIIHANKTIAVGSTRETKIYEATVDIPITSAISAGTGYDLYAKLMGIPGRDIFSQIYEDVLVIIGTTEEVIIPPPINGPPPWPEPWEEPPPPPGPGPEPPPLDGPEEEKRETWFWLAIGAGAIAILALVMGRR